MAGDEYFEGGCVHGAQVIVFVETYDPIATWTALVNGKVAAFCSCGGSMGSGSAASVTRKLEHVEVQWARKKSSTCRHASALLTAYAAMASEMGLRTCEALLSAVPSLAGPTDATDGKPADTIVHLVGKVGKRLNIPLYAVCYMMVWAPTIVRPGGNRYKLATCCLLSCQTQPWGCPHAKAVNRHNRIEATAASEAAAEAQLALRFGPDGVLNEMGDPPEDGPVAVAPSVQVNPTAPPSPRRARNMFPCSKEVEQCDAYGKYVDAERVAGNAYRYDDRLLVEESCIVCQSPRGDLLSSSTIALLYTIRGRMQVLVGEWGCPNGHVVQYDGSADGLFAATPLIVYTRVFLDLVLELCVIARSTMASASQYLTSLLRNTAAYGDGEPGQARQLLSHAVGEFSDTLVIPAAVFKCHHCGHEEASGGPYRCIVCDGQMLSVLQAHIKEMIRPGGNAPRVDFSIVFACALRSSSVRGIVRRRMRTKVDEEVELTLAESRAWPLFLAAANTAPPPAPPLPTADGAVARSPQDDELALRWSTSVLFKHFFAVQRREGAAARGAGAVPAAVPQPPPQDANGDAPEHVADGVPPLPVADAEVLLQEIAVEDGAASSDEYEDIDIDETNSGTTSASDGTGSSGIETEASISSARSELVGDGHAGDGGSADELGSPGSERTVEQRAVVGSPQAASLLGAKDRALGDSPPPARGLHSTSPSTATSSSPSSSPPPPRRRRGAAAAGPARRPSRGAGVGPTPPPTRRLRRRRGAVALRTRSDPWGMQVGEVEQVPLGENASEDPVAVNRKDLLSPLTMRAIKATADAITPAPDGAAAMIVKVGSIPLQLEDFHLTMPGQWFNDELLNGYVELLRVRQLRLSSGINPKPHYIFFN